MKVSEAMTHYVESVRPEATLQEAAGRMKTLDVGSMPVCDNNRLAGILTDRDITIRATALGKNPASVQVREVMTPEAIYCFEDQDVAEAADLMRENQIRRLLVLNRDKRLVGIVSLGDLAVETGDEQLAGHALEGISELAAPAR